MPEWVKFVNKVLGEDEDKERKIKSLYGVAYKRLKEIETHKSDIISFPDVFQKLGKTFSIPKEKCWDILLVFRDLGLIEIIQGHGIRIKKKN